MVVMYKTESLDIVQATESLRARYGIPKFNVLIDQDGVGGGALKLGGYRGFSGGAQPLKEKRNVGEERAYKEQRLENFQNLKTQCAYKVAEENINTGNIKINVHQDLCMVAGMRSRKAKVGGEVIDILDLVKQDLRSYRRAERNNEGKLKIEDKAQQKERLNGRSPDFGDNVLMRKYFDLLPERKGIEIS
jgi:hypothetical protein